MGISLQQIADAAGVSKITVSRALRGTPGVNPEKADRIRGLARELGYVPNPVVSRLAAQRWGHGSRTPDSTIAFVTYRPFYSEEKNRDLDLGVKKGAAQMGYRLEMLELARRKRKRTLEQELRAKGIPAVLIGTMQDGAPALELSWPRYTVVTVHAQQVRLPHFSAVRQNVGQGLALAIAKMLSKGYRRLGAVMLMHSPGLWDDVLREGFLAVLRHKLEGTAVGLESLWLRRQGGRGDPRSDAARLKRWIEQTRPDAVIGFNGYIRHLLNELCGYRFPDDFGYCDLISNNPRRGGLLRTEFLEGLTAVRFMDVLLRAGERGVPFAPMIQHPGHIWVEHPELPRRRAVSPAIQRLLETGLPPLTMLTSLEEARKADLLPAHWGS